MMNERLRLRLSIERKIDLIEELCNGAKALKLFAFVWLSLSDFLSLVELPFLLVAWFTLFISFHSKAKHKCLSISISLISDCQLLVLTHLSCQLSRSELTWLILPVAICLSQRLSHACPSSAITYMWNREWLIKSVLVHLFILTHMNNCGNPAANAWSCRLSFVRSELLLA